MLSNGDLFYMRDALEELLPDTCNVLTQTIVIDGQGGAAQTWGTAQAGVACRLDPGRKEMVERVTGAALQPYSYWWLTLPHGTGLNEQQRIEHGGEVYNVVGVDTDKSWSASVRAVVQRV